ncbi:hypothetical protein PG997_015146 [Apiospora hydei]|uniref:Uncharacterized protein n=1 Tax=Apiospora hydei TaxID=1337664 RepID=A0ABR1UYZ8_9PEZI
MATTAVTSETNSIVPSSVTSSSVTSSSEFSSTSSPTPTGEQTHSSSISSGTVAGAVVGAFLGGLLIGLAILLLWRRRQARKPLASHQRPKRAHTEGIEPEDHGGTNGISELDPFLLDATSDKQLAEAYQNISKVLQQHVANFYHKQAVDVDIATLRHAIERVDPGPNNALQHDVLPSLLLDPRTRAAAIQHTISHVLVKAIDFNSPGELSLLPPHVVGFVRSVPALERGGGNADVAMRKALGQWRTLTAYLMQPHRSHRLPLVPSEEVAKPQIDQLALALTHVLRPFIDSEELSQTKQKRHLQALAFDCAKLGYALLSQPCEWQFVYENPDQDKGQHSLVLHPGLQKVGGWGGEKYGVPQLVEAPVVAKI